MKIITQLNLFEEQELGDLEKILMVLDGLPETDLFDKLEAKRKHGRKDYSIQSYFIAYIAKIVLQLETDQQLIRQLNMNSQLRQICGFETHGVTLKKGTIKLVHAPSKSAYSRFIQDLEEVCPDIEEWVLSGISELYDLLPNFGVNLALDGKFIDSYASPYGKQKKKDKRADLDADIGIKQRPHKNGTATKENHYGYRCHLMVDTTYELPVVWRVTPASKGEPRVAKELIRNLSQTTLETGKYLMADKGYSGRPLQALLEEAQIITIIDNPHKWKENSTRQYLDTDLIYNQSGQVFWVDDRGQAIQLVYKGYDSSSDSSRYVFHPKYQDKRIFRLKRCVDPIIFNPVARDSKKFKRLYKKRTAVERVNGRLDRDFRFETHTIRGLKKMSLAVAMSFLVMIGFALRKAKSGTRTHLASWVV
ncbi:transposase [Streptococcus pneumoniae]|uniref:transposase n=1 Tax=Streptococcus pneumoniae TaxID=1313 RepID=UPI000598E2E4|nr:transposase [Streptococcus pneumoniae]CEO61269.1 Transposase DDE domain [Streptococcus pneumoniae]CEO64092.1 Transposase DDE domain [Streptococcus pneumoniae]CEV56292.1 Transposase DDE domain [Streptococcus pneumoniae]CEV60868.1 Transposase DDE domain [Streptococcus pneumoniae]CEX05223.1 Transposase DDE domain [Streptococcus pneumoniae]